jgi:hypothetical protein
MLEKGIDDILRNIRGLVADIWLHSGNSNETFVFSACKKEKKIK